MKNSLEATIAKNNVRWNIFVKPDGEAFIQEVNGDITAEASWNGMFLLDVYPPEIPAAVLDELQLTLRGLVSRKTRNKSK